MRAWGVVLVALLTAGCAAPASIVLPIAPPGLESFKDCPMANGALLPCEIEGDSHIGVDVRDQVPPGWTCLTFADERFKSDEFSNPYPDWYTYYGPFFGDGGRGAGENRMGILYDTHDDAASVSGALVLRSENETRVYTWQGPPSGFVLVPQRISRPELLAYGVLYPDPGPTKGQFNASVKDHPWITNPGFTVDGDPVVDLSPFWSMSPWTPQGASVTIGGDEAQQWNLVQGAQLGGQRLHFATEREGNMGWGDSKGLAGTAHWGTGRNAAFNVSVDVQGLTMRASLQPYMEFYSQFHDLSSPTALASAQFLCGCRDQPLTTVEGIRCQLGLQAAAVGDEDEGLHTAVVLG